MITAETIYRGRLRGRAIGASILVAACEAVGIQHDMPGVKLRSFRMIGQPRDDLDWPDVDFVLVVRRPKWAA